MSSPKTPPRPGPDRKRHALRRLAEDIDIWVATTSADGVPCMVPLSFLWHEGTIWMCTRPGNPTAANLRSTGRAVLSLDGTRDVVLIEADGEVVPVDAMSPAEAGAFAERLWDVRGSDAWVALRCVPRTVRAWREENELAGRRLMRDGAWLV
ncbi:pyridoxamine 5'-phosphate oxidase family protein [Streptomyces sodiiphilus]